MWRVIAVVMWCMALAVAPIPLMAQTPSDSDASAKGQLLAQNPILAEVGRLDPDALPSLIDSILRIRMGQSSKSRTGAQRTAAEWTQIMANPALADDYQHDPDETLVLLRKTNESLRKARLGAALDAPKRLALVIGSSGNDAWGQLTTPVHDAELIAGIISKQLGFQLVTGNALINPDRETMKRAIRNFGHTIGPDTVALFYYAGHGKQFEGSNYLVPTGAEMPHSRDDYTTELIDVDDVVIRQMKQAGGRLNIIVLDACRDQSFDVAMRGGSRGLQGLAPTIVPADMTGTVVVYSTSPGALAHDYIHEGDRDSPFTTAFAAAITERGVEMHDAFDKLYDTVWHATKHTQAPSINYMASGKFYFASPPVSVFPSMAMMPVPSVKPLPPAPLPSRRSDDLEQENPHEQPTSTEILKWPNRGLNANTMHDLPIMVVQPNTDDSAGVASQMLEKNLMSARFKIVKNYHEAALIVEVFNVGANAPQATEDGMFKSTTSFQVKAIWVGGAPLFDEAVEDTQTSYGTSFSVTTARGEGAKKASFNAAVQKATALFLNRVGLP